MLIFVLVNQQPQALPLLPPQNARQPNWLTVFTGLKISSAMKKSCLHLLLIANKKVDFLQCNKLPPPFANLTLGLRYL